MKRMTIILATFMAMVWQAGVWHHALAGTAEEIKEGSKEAVSEIKKNAVETGKAMADTGKEVKEGTQKGWSEFKEDAVKAGVAVKESVKEVGRDIKKAFNETKTAVTKEFTGNETAGQDQDKEKGAGK